MYAGVCQGPKAFSSKEAKVRAIFFALMNSTTKGFSKVCVLLDAKVVVNALNGCCDWITNSIILVIKCLASSFDYIRFTFLPRSKEGTHMPTKLKGFILDWGKDLRGDG